jgi:hypothetical protein
MSMSTRIAALYAAATIALLPVPAYSQISGGKAAPGPPPPAAKTRQEIEADRKADEAYKNSLKNIPNQAPADPWGIARGAETPKAATKAAPAKSGPKTGTTAN